MYFLPVTTYSDYLKASGKWTVWTGGALLVGIMLNSQQPKGLSQPELNLYQRYQVSVDGITKLVNTRSLDPYEVIREAKIGLGPNDIISTKGNMIQITRIEERLVVEESSIPFTTEKRTDYNLAPGTTKVVAKGQGGLKRDIVRIIYAGNREVSREIIDTEVLREAKKKIVVSNPRPPITATRSVSVPVDLKFLKEFLVESTAYTFTGNNTATGVPPRVGLVAVDPRIIPLGTKLFIEGYGYATAGDTGGAIKGLKIDVFFNSRNECLTWGRRRVRIYILGK